MMILQKFFFGLLVLVVLVPGPLFAVSDDITISQQIGIDNSPPSTPFLQTVVPVTSSQIDITWSAATDDLLVAGYRLFRDNVQIATTTLLSYSDTGLTASTTYQYTVDAFDASFNFSSTSPAVSTTTLNIVVPPTPTSTPGTIGSSGTRTATNLLTLDITASERSALFTWETNSPTQYVLVWGRTTAYELGSVSGSTYKQNHSTFIDTLEPGTTYYYELRGITTRGLAVVLAADRFTTKTSLSNDVLTNVQGFIAQTKGNDVTLSWKNSFTNPDYYVRIVRSHLFYPSTIQDGAVVYEGRGESFVDVGSLLLRSPQYYTIFVRSNSGEVSSGAIARANKVQAVGGEVATTTPPPVTIPPDIGDDTIVRAADVTIVQNERTQIFDSDITLDKDSSYLVSIPYTAVAKNLKSIIVSVQNPTNQRELSAYLLKLNQAGDAYTALIPPPAVVGVAGIMIEVFDYEAQTVRRISTNISYVDTTIPAPFFPDQLLGYFVIGWPLLLVLLGTLWFILFARRRHS